MRVHSIILPALVLVLTYSCEPLKNASDKPEVSFKSFDLYYAADTLGQTLLVGEVVFDFVDGDSDFGILSNSSDEKRNLFFIPYRKLNNQYDSIDYSIYGREYRILDDDRLHREGKYTTIKGEIQVLIEYYLDMPYDTVKYDFYIVDRAGHKSNIESTSDVGFTGFPLPVD